MMLQVGDDGVVSSVDEEELVYVDKKELEQFIESYQELKKENEQLKQSYAQLKHRHSLLHDECLDAECDRDRYHKDVLSLEKENEQLKQTIQDMRIRFKRKYDHEFDDIVDELD